MSDDRNEVVRAHSRLSAHEEALADMRRQPLSAQQLDALLTYINTCIDAKRMGDDPDPVSATEAREIRENLLGAFGITEDDLDEVEP